MPPKKALAFVAGVAISALLATGCGSKSDDAGSAASAAPRAAGQVTDAVNVANTLTPIAVQPRKIIYKAEVTLDCVNLDKASDKLLTTVKSMGGYVGDATSSGTRGTVRESSWTVRIPVERYDDFFRALPGMGELETSSQKAEDVSEEFYDAQARLKNKNVEEERLVDLLKNHSGRLSDILTLEKELSRVREEIERIEGRIHFLANQADLSTVTVTLREVKDFIPEGSPTLGTRTGRAFSGSIDAMKELGSEALVALVAVVPWLLPLGLVALIGWRIAVRKPKAKSPVKPTILD